MKRDGSPPITRRRFVQRAAIVLGTLITAACGAGGTPTPAPTRAPAPTPRPTSAPPPSATPPSIGAADQTLVVDGAHPDASDTNPGSDARPLKTVAKAAELAVQNNLRRVSTRVVIAAGVYRESVAIQSKTPLTDVPMIFAAREPGKVTIAGSDVWTGWTKGGAANIYTHAWPYKWGLVPIPKGWEGQVNVQPIVRRREMLFIEGQPLTQVLAERELKAGTFIVSEEKGTVSFIPPAEVTAEGGTIEVAVRPTLFVTEGAQNLTVQGITFMHGNSPIGETAVIFTSCTNLRVEDCGFYWNNWSAMTFQSGPTGISQSVAARRNVANYNGAIGMEASRVKDLFYDQNETSYNNWRGALGGMLSWSNAGMKHLFIHGGVYQRHRAIGNRAPGCWFDTDCANIQIDRAFCSRNHIGLFLEASEGPMQVTNSTFCNSTSDNIFTEGADGVTLDGNILYGGARAGIHALTGVRPVDNWETKESYKLVSQHWALRKNIVVGTDTAPHLVNIGNSAGANKKLFLSTLMSDDNVWFSPKASEAFVVDDKGRDFGAWQSLSKRDGASRFVDPQFVDPGGDNFVLRDTSPLRDDP